MRARAECADISEPVYMVTETEVENADSDSDESDSF